jgi:hypothetical protein
MRRLVFAVLALAFILPLTAQAQREQLPEHQRLGVWVGEWSYEIGDGTGTMVFEWFGDFFVKASEVTPNGANVLHVFGYDAEEEVYLWHRYYNSGGRDTAKGWVHDNTWTFVFDEPAGRRRRMTMVEESSTVIAFKWERSVEGGPWEVTAEGRETRVR